MPNILLTQQCVRSCPYCFARKHMEEASPADKLTWENLVYLADFFLSQEPRHLSLLGGEPTLHPEFAEYVAYLVQRGYHVTVFTSAIMSEKRLADLARLKELPRGSYNFVVNLNDPQSSSEVETKRINAFLEQHGAESGISFNIYSLDFDMNYVFDYIQKYSMRKHLRLGLAHPIPGETNRCVALEDLPELYNRLCAYIPEFEKLHIVPGFDCGFTLCGFTDEQLGKLYKLSDGMGRSLKFGCNAALDIGPDMQVWSCFPLSQFKRRSIFEFDTVKDYSNFYRGFHEETRKTGGGAFDACRTCRHRESGLCAGGCLSHILIREGIHGD